MSAENRTELLKLVESVELAEIVTFELAASRNQNSGEASPQGEILIEPMYNLQIFRSDKNDGFLTRISVAIELPFGKLKCEVGAAYSAESSLLESLSEKVILDFTNEVALYAVFPYLRQNISDLSLKVLNVPLVIPVLKPGQLIFELH